MATLCLNRMGEVTAHHKSNHQCKVKGHSKYKYHVKVICPSESIDKNTGFLVDHVVINDLIQKLFEKEISSCERLCVDIAKEIKKYFKVNGIVYNDIYVKLQPVIPEGETLLAFMEYADNNLSLFA